MKTLISVVTFAIGLSVGGSAQSGGTEAAQNPTATGVGQINKESNAASAKQDSSAISGDQVTKPAGAKSKTVTGCLAGPDSDGHFLLTSMQYRSGIEVLGPVNLQNAAGQKVKLTGDWAPANRGQQEEAGNKPAKRFQATSLDVIADKCSTPAETTPISKKKQKEQKAAARDAANNQK